MTRLVPALIAVLVACGGSPAAPADASPDGRKVSIVVDGMGYTPASVEATPGEALTLIFDRIDANNCGGELVFPSTGRKIELPVGKKVEVAVTAPPSGELAFTCGMAMYEGAVVVSGG